MGRERAGVCARVRACVCARVCLCCFLAALCCASSVLRSRMLHSYCAAWRAEGGSGCPAAASEWEGGAPWEGTGPLGTLAKTARR